MIGDGNNSVVVGEKPTPSSSSSAPPPPARAPSPAPHLTAPAPAYVPHFLGSIEGIEEAGTGGKKEEEEEDRVLVLGSGRPVARAPRDSEPGGWPQEVQETLGGRRRRLSEGTPPAVSRLSSLTLEDALSGKKKDKEKKEEQEKEKEKKEKENGKEVGVAASVATTVGGRGPPPSSLASSSPFSASKKQPQRRPLGTSSFRRPFRGGGLVVGSCRGSMDPSCPPGARSHADGPGALGCVRLSGRASAEAEPLLLAPHILR